MNIDEIKKSLEEIKDGDKGKAEYAYNFITDLVLQGDIKNIQKINARNYNIATRNYREYCSIFNNTKVIQKEKLLLDKLLNNKNDIVSIYTGVYFNHTTVEIYYSILVNDTYTGIDAKVLKHKIKIYKNTYNSKIINEYREIDITNNYLNNIFSVAKNISNNFVKIKPFNKKIVIDFINSSRYNKKFKDYDIKLIDTLPDKFVVSDFFTIYKQMPKFNKQPILDFMNLVFNNIFEKSIPKDLLILNYNIKNIQYDRIINSKIIEKLNFFNEQYKILGEVL